MTPSFNLLNEPWIRVVNCAGKTEEVSLRELFSRASGIRRLAGEMHTQDFAVLRVALAILYRAFDFDDDFDDNQDRWTEAWQSKELPLEEINQYLDRFEKRFDLLDSDAPFLQTPTLATKRGEWKSLEVLVPDSPELGNLFYRRSADSPISFAEATRWLIHCMAYDFSGIKSGAVGDDRVKGGKGYPIGIGWCGWLGGSSLEGKNFLETLLLNIVDNEESAWSGVPAWEAEVPTAAENTALGAGGQLTLFTWPQRRVRLRIQENQVIEALVCNGDPVEYTTQLGIETMTPWRYSEPQSKKFKRDVYMPRALNPDRLMWRSLAAILPMETREQVKGRSGETVDSAKPATILNVLRRRVREGVVSQEYQVKMRTVGYEYGPQMASFNRMLSDELTLPALLTASEDVLEIALLAVGRAQAAANELRKFANNLSVAAGGERGSAGARAENTLFDLLDPRFRSWLQAITSSTDVEDYLQQWTDMVRRLTLQLGEDLVARVPDKAWHGHEDGTRTVNVGNSERWFRIGLSKALPRAEKPQEEMVSK